LPGGSVTYRLALRVHAVSTQSSMRCERFLKSVESASGFQGIRIARGRNPAAERTWAAQNRCE